MTRSCRDRNRWKGRTRYRPRAEDGFLARDPALRLIRLVGDETSDGSGQRLGVLKLGYRALRENGILQPGDRATVESIIAWFERYLRTPRRFSPFKEGFRRRGSGDFIRDPIAISWMKETATQHVGRLRALAAPLGRAGLRIHELVTRRPGYVVYEDEHQVVAVPFSDTDWTERLLA